MDHREQAWHALNAAGYRLLGVPDDAGGCWRWTFFRNAQKAFTEGSYGEAMVLSSLV